MSLQFGLSFDDLYRREGLLRIDAAFVDHLKAVDAGLCARLMDARVHSRSRKLQSELMVELAPHVDDFVGGLFGISTEALEARHEALGPVYALKRKFIQKKAISGVTAEKASAINGRAAAMELEALFNEPLTEASFVDHVSRWLEDEANHAAELGVAAQYGAWAALS
ncbi:MAG: pyridine nucleotide-disulfide oxidoreductase, partial [Bryobacteraceae bacterium]